MPSKHKVATKDELPDGSRVIAEISGQEIAVFHVDGNYHAVSNYCIHQGGPLCEGKLTGETYIDDNGWDWNYDDDEKHITCPWHGWLFDVTNGENIHNSKYKLPTYPVEVNDDDIYVVR